MKKVSLTVLSLFLLIVLAACGNDSPSDAVVAYMKDFKAGKVEIMSWVDIDVDDDELTKEEEKEIENSPEYKVLTEKLDATEYEILTENISDDQAEVTVKVNGLDYYDLMRAYWDKMLSLVDQTFDDEANDGLNVNDELTEERDDMYLSVLEETPFTEREGIFILNKRNDKWVITNKDELSTLLIHFDDDLLNAFFESTLDGNL